MALLSYLDFFSTGVQVTYAISMCVWWFVYIWFFIRSCWCKVKDISMSWFLSPESCIDYCCQYVQKAYLGFCRFCYRRCSFTYQSPSISWRKGDWLPFCETYVLRLAICVRFLNLFLDITEHMILTIFKLDIYYSFRRNFQVLEYASICLTRIAEAFASSPEKLDTLCNHGLVAQAATLISIGNSGVAQAPLSTSTYTVGWYLTFHVVVVFVLFTKHEFPFLVQGLIRLLSICVSGSAIGAKTLFLLGISGILKEILSGSGEVSSIFVLPVLYRPPEQVFNFSSLLVGFA